MIAPKLTADVTVKRKRGRPPIRGDGRPMTNAEYCRRWYARHRRAALKEQSR